uniref:G-protein coupled receptors family 1 profile domain-containing protein n=1 Tax=Acrobeloides nanus TaxID=290746 RepID=A0A914D6K3_9BILA
MASLLLFAKRFHSQVVPHKQVPKIQKKVFKTVSVLLFFYTLIYVIPTIMQIMKTWLGLPSVIGDLANNMVFYGAEVIGALDAGVLLLTHSEFKKCNKRVVFGILGKAIPVEQVSKNSKVVSVNRRTNPTSSSMMPTITVNSTNF